MSESWSRPDGPGQSGQGQQPGAEGPRPDQPRPPQQGGFPPPHQQGQPGQGPQSPQNPGRPEYGGQQDAGRPQPGGPGQPPYGAPPGGWHQGQAPGQQGPYPGQPQQPGKPAKSTPPLTTSQILRFVFAGLAAVLVILGVSLPIDGETMWTEGTLWTIFGVLAVLAAGALAFVRASKDVWWLVGVSGVAALALFWVLIMLPGITSNNGFLVTVGLGLAALGLYLANDASAGSSGRAAAENAAKNLT